MTAKRPFSPSDGLHKFDDFFDNEAVADATIGELNWEIVTIGNASTYAALVTTNTGVGQYGVIRATTAATADGDGSVIRLDEDNVVLGPKGGEMKFKFRYPVELASLNFKFGLQDGVTAADPGSGIVLTSDAGVLSIEAFSADHGDESAALAQPADNQTLTSGTTAVVATWHEAVIRWFGTNAQGGPGNVECYLDGILAGSIPCNIDDDEELEFSLVTWQDSGSADAVAFDFDYVELFVAR